MEWPRDLCDDLDDFRLERSIRSVKVKKTNSKRFESNEIAIKLILDSRRDRKAKHRRKTESDSSNTSSSKVSVFEIKSTRMLERKRRRFTTFYLVLSFSITRALSRSHRNGQDDAVSIVPRLMKENEFNTQRKILPKICVRYNFFNFIYS